MFKQLRTLALTPRARALALAIVIGATAWAFRAAVSTQTPRTFWDSSAYLQAAGQPWSWAQLYYPKPLFTTLVYRAIGTDLATIVHVQAAFALASWLVLGAALVTALRRPPARAAAVVAIAVFVLAPNRVGYVDAILSESINDSMMALVLAAALWLTRATGRWRIAGVCGLVLAGVPWIFTRDTNAVTVLVAIAVCAGSLRGRLVRDWWAIIAAACLACASAVAMWSANVVPPPTGLTVQSGWAPDFTARTTLSMMNNVFDRVLPDDEARAYFVERGLPQVDELRALMSKEDNRSATFFDPHYADARRWIAGHARSVWTHWLVRHPVERLLELAQNGWTLLGADRDQVGYMPVGWYGGHRSLARDLTWNLPVLIALLLLAPIALWRARRHPCAFVARCAIASGFAATAVAFYGDPAEPARHCFGAGQQIVFGLVLALLAQIDSRVGLLRTTGSAART
jgi:hypothetical protein